MGIITVEKSDNLLWLGRYVERVHTELKFFLQGSDRMIDADPKYYSVICEKIEIPDIYLSGEDFVRRFPFDESNPDSIISNLNRAYDNAIVLRNDIGTETMAYIQLALDDIKHAEHSASPIADLILVIDHIFAFWGCVNDRVDDEVTRNIIKLGMGLERIDLYLSLDRPASDIQREYGRLGQFLKKSHMRYNENVLYTIDNMLSEYGFNYQNIKNLLRNLIVQ